MRSFFFRKPQLITILLLICDSYMNWRARFVSQKLWGFPFSILFHFYSSLYFYSRKCMDFLTLKRHNFFQNQNSRKATHSFVTDSDKLFNLRESKFWENQFFSMVYKKTDEWYIEWQQMRTNDNEWYNDWQRVATNDNEWYNKWQQVAASSATSDSEWQRVVQQVTTNDNGWQRMTTSNKKWQ